MSEKTETKIIEGTNFCVYCGKQAMQGYSGSYHNNDDEEFYYCNCEGAKLEIKFREEEWLLKRRHTNELYDLKQQCQSLLKEIEYETRKKKLDDSIRRLNKEFGK